MVDTLVAVGIPDPEREMSMVDTLVVFAMGTDRVPGMEMGFVDYFPLFLSSPS